MYFSLCIESFFYEFQIILGGPFKAAERYRPDFFLQFRCCNIIDQAIEYARTSYSEPLEELFTYHGGDVLPHWLAILSNFPETTPVSSYQRLLPSVRYVPHVQCLPKVLEHFL